MLDRSVAFGADLGMSFLGGMGGDSRYGIIVLRPGHKDLHDADFAFFGRLSCTFRVANRRGVNHDIGDGTLAVLQGLGIGRAARA